MLGQSESAQFVQSKIAYPKQAPKKLSVPPSYCVGYFSYIDGVDEADNPFPYGEEDYWAWRRGWYACKKDKELPWYKKSALLVYILIAIIGLILAVSQANPVFSGLGLSIISIISLLITALSGREIIISIDRDIMLRRLGKKKDEKEEKPEN